MKKYLLLLPLLIACAELPEPNPVPIPKVLVAAEVPEPTVVLSRQELLKPLLNTLKLMSEEQLPFDEPKTEFEQQDGSLRPRWESAYLAKRGSYFFNNDKYYVYGQRKTPRPPQVCADFISDTLERAGGTWYSNNQRVIGKVEIRESMKSQQLESRRVFELITYFKSQPDNYQFVWAVDDPRFAPTNYWGGPKVTPVNGPEGLKVFLKEHRVQVGDMIFISGKVPWDQEKEAHNHSMFVTGLDKDKSVEYITGNDAWVREKTLAIEMARAPKRQVKYIVRLTDNFLLNL